MHLIGNGLDRESHHMLMRNRNLDFITKAIIINMIEKWNVLEGGANMICCVIFRIQIFIVYTLRMSTLVQINHPHPLFSLQYP